METKELKIQIPKGYEIDKENSSFEKIVFKPIDTKPRSWEEYCKNTSKDSKYIIRVDSIVDCLNGFEDSNLIAEYDKNLLPSREYAEAFLALMQLISLRQAWIGDWKPDWKDDTTSKWSIFSEECELNIGHFYCTSYPLTFPTKETAKEFLECFKDLLEKAKILL